jgi:hypothetical protein
MTHTPAMMNSYTHTHTHVLGLDMPDRTRGTVPTLSQA